ncbi:MAG TPA: hypothetical protein VFH47_06675, partial [Candidatus Thermoplasmatota archaeon]|nr:hypothetical protein [Candidatus Thermoplasmatota archaeon]
MAALLALLAGCAQPASLEPACGWHASARDPAFYTALQDLASAAPGEGVHRSPAAAGAPLPAGWLTLPAANATSARLVGQDLAVGLQWDPPAADLAVRLGQDADAQQVADLLAPVLGADASATASLLVDALEPGSALHPFRDGFAPARAARVALAAPPLLLPWIPDNAVLHPLGAGSLELLGPTDDGQLVAYVSVPSARLGGDRAEIVADAYGTVHAASLATFRSGDGFEVELNT